MVHGGHLILLSSETYYTNMFYLKHPITRRLF